MSGNTFLLSLSLFQNSSSLNAKRASANGTNDGSSDESVFASSKKGGFAGTLDMMSSSRKGRFSGIVNSFLDKVSKAADAVVNTVADTAGDVVSGVKAGLSNVAKALGFSSNLTDSQKRDLVTFKQNYENNKGKYETVSKKTGIPAELIAALHWRESSGNFGTYLHNGEKLGKVTTLVPAGKLFHDWESAAIDALQGGYGNVEAGNLKSYLEYAERYNGLGYRNKGLPSPYVWSGTNKYSSGKYVADGVFNPDAKDSQLGVAIMLDSIMV